MVTIEIKGAGGTINYPTEVIVKALKDAGLQVEVNDEHPADNVEELLAKTKERIDSGYIKEWKAVVRTTHYPWGG